MGLNGNRRVGDNKFQNNKPKSGGKRVMKQLCVCLCVFLGRGLLFFGLLYPHLTPTGAKEGGKGEGNGLPMYGPAKISMYTQ